MKLFKDKYPGYTLKGLKYFRGMEGHGFNATLLKDGRKISFVMDEGCGGMLRYEDLSDADRQMLKELVEVKRMEQSDVKDASGFCDREHFDLDWMIQDMINAWDYETKMRRMAKKKTIFVTPDCKEGEARTLNGPYDANAKAFIFKKYPNAVILNELLA